MYFCSGTTEKFDPFFQLVLGGAILSGIVLRVGATLYQVWRKRRHIIGLLVLVFHMLINLETRALQSEN